MASSSQIPVPSTSTTAPPSDSTSATTTGGGAESAEDDSRAALAEPVLKCLRALENATTDTEKMAALFLVPKLVKGDACDKNARLHLMKGIGFSFLARMLRSHDAPDGCPRLMFQSVALSVLSCFTGEEEIMTNASVLFNVPVLIDIIADADSPIYEENLLIINDAYTILSAIASTAQGRSAFINNRGVHFLCDICVRQSFQCEKALTLLTQILLAGGPICWRYHNGVEDFNKLMDKFTTEFAEVQDATKFELCDTLRIILRSFPKTEFDDVIAAEWLSRLQRGLRDILFSKISKELRDPALKLVAAIIEMSDFEWCLDDENAKSEEHKSRFLLIIVNLACIETIICLDDIALEVAVEASAEMLMACYSVMESTISYMVNDKLAMVDEKQKEQLYAALKNGFSTILKFLHECSLTLSDDPKRLDDPKTRFFVCATIRVLCAWLSEETSAAREDVYRVLPFIVNLCTETFNAQKSAKLRSLPDRVRAEGSRTGATTKTSSSSAGESFEDTSVLVTTQGYSTTPDILRFLLPGLCHLVAEEKSRQLLLEQCSLHETLFAYLAYHWTIYNSYRRIVKEQPPVTEVSLVEVSAHHINARFEVNNSRYALVSICNVLMNLNVLEADFVDRQPVFFHTLKFVMNMLPMLENQGEELVLYGNLSVLGLFILKQHSRRPKASDFSIFKFIQAVIRFLWDAHNCDESGEEEPQMSVSSAYLEFWEEIQELWFLGMQVFSSLLEPVPWLVDFVLDSGWSSELLTSLSSVPRAGVRPEVRAALEDLLASLVKAGGSDVAKRLKDEGAPAACQSQQMWELAAAISKAK